MPPAIPGASPTPLLRAAIYTRISSDKEGRENGVQRQYDLCLDLARRRRTIDVDNVREFRDNDISASTRSKAERPRYAAMLRAVKDGEIDVILAYSNSRLTRRPREFIDLIDLINEKKIRIFTVAGGAIDLATEEGKAIAITVAAWDAAEAGRASERVKAAVDQRREQGLWHGGSIPYGYRIEGEKRDRRLVIEEAEADLLREAADRLLAGDTMYSICKDWDVRGLTTDRVAKRTVGDKSTPHGRRWRQTTLRKMLLNRALLGENVIGKTVAPAVLGARTFERVTARLIEPSRVPANAHGVKSSRYSMTGGLTVCGTCGKRMFGQVHREREIAFCSKAAHGSVACGSNRIDHTALERFVLERVVNSLRHNDAWLDLSRGSNPAQDGALAALEAERDDLNAQQTRLADNLVRGSIDARTGEQHAARIRGELRDVQHRIDGLLGNSEISTAIARGLDWETWSPALRRNFLKRLLDRVEVLPDPEGRVTSIRRRFRQGETTEQFEQRRHDLMVESLKDRVALIPRSQVAA